MNKCITARMNDVTQTARDLVSQATPVKCTHTHTHTLTHSHTLTHTHTQQTKKAKKKIEGPSLDNVNYRTRSLFTCFNGITSI